MTDTEATLLCFAERLNTRTAKSRAVIVSAKLWREVRMAAAGTEAATERRRATCAAGIRSAALKSELVFICGWRGVSLWRITNPLVIERRDHVCRNTELPLSSIDTVH